MMILGVVNRQDITSFAYNGELAVKAIQKAIEENDHTRYKLILMDCNMPFMDGYEATKKIRRMFASIGVEREHQPKIYAITGHVESEYVTKALKYGMDKVF